MKITFRQILVSLLLALPFFILIFKTDVIVFSRLKHNVVQVFSEDETPVYYADLNNDGTSEKVKLANYHGLPGIELRDLDNKYLGLYRPQGMYATSHPNLQIADIDSDGFDEIFVVTLINDSLYLNYEEPFDTISKLTAQIYLDTTRKVQGVYNVGNRFLPPTDLNADGHKDIVFSMTAGYPLFPRKVYVLDGKTLTVSKTNTVGAPFQVVDVADMNNDKKQEIFLKTIAIENFPPNNNLKYDDNSAYIAVLNNNLDFTFEPIRFSENKPAITSFPFYINDSCFIGSYLYEYNTNQTSLFMLHNNKGELKDSFHIPSNYRAIYLNAKINKNSLITLVDEKRSLKVYNHEFKMQESVDTYYALYRNLGSLGDLENIIVASDEKNKLTMLDQACGYLYEIEFDTKIEWPIKKVMVDGQEMLSVKTIHKTHIVSLKTNPAYKFRCLVMMAIYIGLAFFFFLILYAQALTIKRRNNRLQAQLTLKTEAVNNQLQPHFTFNVLNTIGSLIYKDKKEEAYDYLQQFSTLLRKIIVSKTSDEWTLADELEFIDSYMTLEKSRFKEKIDFVKYVESSVNTGRRIPKLHIQSHIENAVKHGLSAKNAKGTLTLKLVEDKSHTTAFIQDNVVGRQRKSTVNQNGTGKGIVILRDFYDIYNKEHQNKFSLTFEDLDSGKKDRGTRVILKIPKDYA